MLNQFAMPGRRRSVAPTTWVLVLSLVLVCGCGGDDRTASMKALNSSNSKRLSNIYYEFQASHRWFGPKDEEDLRSFIGALSPEQMELVGIDAANIDSLFVSERDGEPFKIRYKVRGSFAASDPVIFESKGVDGVRLVGFTGLKEEMIESADAYDKLWKGKVERQVSSREAAEATYGE